MARGISAGAPGRSFWVPAKVAACNGGLAGHPKRSEVRAGVLRGSKKSRPRATMDRRGTMTEPPFYPAVFFGNKEACSGCAALFPGSPEGPAARAAVFFYGTPSLPTRGNLLEM